MISTQILILNSRTFEEKKKQNTPRTFKDKKQNKGTKENFKVNSDYYLNYVKQATLQMLFFQN